MAALNIHKYSSPLVQVGSKLGVTELLNRLNESDIAFLSEAIGKGSDIHKFCQHLKVVQTLTETDLQHAAFLFETADRQKKGFITQSDFMDALQELMDEPGTFQEVYDSQPSIHQIPMEQPAKVVLIQPLRLLALMGQGNSVALCNVDSGVKAGTLKGHSRPVSHLVFHERSKSLVTCSEDRTVAVWDARFLAPRIPPRGIGKFPRCMAILPSSKIFYSKALNAASLAASPSLPSSASASSSPNIRPSRASGGDHASLSSHSLGSRSPNRRSSLCQQDPSSPSLPSTSNASSQVHFHLNFPHEQEEAEEERFTQTMNSSSSPSSSSASLSHRDSDVLPVITVDCIDDDRIASAHLLVGTSEGLVLAWPMESILDHNSTVLPRPKIVATHSDWVMDICVMPDLKLVASGSVDKTVKSVETMNGREGYTWTLPFGVHCLSYASTSRLLLISGLASRDIVVLDPTTSAAPLYKLTGHERPVQGVTCLFGGPEIVSLDVKGQIIVHDLRNTQAAQNFRGPTVSAAMTKSGALSALSVGSDFKGKSETMDQNHHRHGASSGQHSTHKSKKAKDAALKILGFQSDPVTAFVLDAECPTGPQLITCGRSLFFHKQIGSNHSHSNVASGDYHHPLHHSRHHHHDDGMVVRGIVDHPLHSVGHSSSLNVVTAASNNTLFAIHGHSGQMLTAIERLEGGNITSACVLQGGREVAVGLQEGVVVLASLINNGNVKRRLRLATREKISHLFAVPIDLLEKRDQHAENKRRERAKHSTSSAAYHLNPPKRNGSSSSLFGGWPQQQQLTARSDSMLSGALTMSTNISNLESLRVRPSSASAAGAGSRAGAGIGMDAASQLMASSLAKKTGGINPDLLAPISSKAGLLCAALTANDLVLLHFNGSDDFKVHEPVILQAATGLQGECSSACFSDATSLLAVCKYDEIVIWDLISSMSRTRLHLPPGQTAVACAFSDAVDAFIVMSRASRSNTFSFPVAPVDTICRLTFFSSKTFNRLAVLDLTSTHLWKPSDSSAAASHPHLQQQQQQKRKRLKVLQADNSTPSVSCALLACSVDNQMCCMDLRVIAQLLQDQQPQQHSHHHSHHDKDKDKEKKSSVQKTKNLMLKLHRKRDSDDYDNSDDGGEGDDDEESSEIAPPFAVFPSQAPPSGHILAMHANLDGKQQDCFPHTTPSFIQFVRSYEEPIHSISFCPHPHPHDHEYEQQAFESSDANNRGLLVSFHNPSIAAVTASAFGSSKGTPPLPQNHHDAKICTIDALCGSIVSTVVPTQILQSAKVVEYEANRPATPPPVALSGCVASTALMKVQHDLESNTYVHAEDFFYNDDADLDDDEIDDEDVEQHHCHNDDDARQDFYSKRMLDSLSPSSASACGSSRSCHHQMQAFNSNICKMCGGFIASSSSAAAVSNNYSSNSGRRARSVSPNPVQGSGLAAVRMSRPSSAASNASSCSSSKHRLLAYVRHDHDQHQHHDSTYDSLGFKNGELSTPQSGRRTSVSASASSSSSSLSSATTKLPHLSSASSLSQTLRPQQPRHRSLSPNFFSEDRPPSVDFAKPPPPQQQQLQSLLESDPRHVRFKSTVGAPVSHGLK